MPRHLFGGAFFVGDVVHRCVPCFSGGAILKNNMEDSSVPHTPQTGTPLVNEGRASLIPKKELEEDMLFTEKARTPSAPLGPIADIIIIVVLFIIGGLYVWGQQLSLLREAQQQTQPVEVRQP